MRVCEHELIYGPEGTVNIPLYAIDLDSTNWYQLHWLVDQRCIFQTKFHSVRAKDNFQVQEEKSNLANCYIFTKIVLECKPFC